MCKQLQLGPGQIPDKEGRAWQARQSIRACDVTHLHAMQRQEPQRLAQVAHAVALRQSVSVACACTGHARPQSSASGAPCLLP